MTNRNLIMQPRFAGLDTSHWAGLCSGLIEKLSRVDATRRLRTLASDGWIPVISFHQLEELLAHENERTAIARLAALRHVQTLAAVTGPAEDDNDVPGTIVDVHRKEIIAAVTDPDADADAVRTKVRGAFLRMTTGDAIVDAVTPTVHLTRQQILAKQERKREISSISQAKVLDQSRAPFYLNGVARPEADIKAHFDAQRAALSEELTRRGDRRLSSPHDTAAAFIESITRDQEALTSGPQPVVELLKTVGLSVADVAGVKNVGQLGELAHFRRNLEVASQGTGISIEVLRGISQERLPTWVIHRALLRHRQVRPHVEGGDLTDGYLLSMAPYFDAMFVDKRTDQDAGRIRKHDADAGSWLTNVRKASSWAKALEQLAVWPREQPA